MKSTLLFPRNTEEGGYLEGLAAFGARRCRTRKVHDELMAEVDGWTPERRQNFLHKVINEDWALDVAEIPYLIYDWEGIPVWMIIELLRHRLIARDFSLEQLSQRAIKITDIDCSPELEQVVGEYVQKLTELGLAPEAYREAIPQGAKVNLVIAGNVRAFHHLFMMRSSEGYGGAHHKFQELTDQALAQARTVYPVLLAPELFKGRL